MALLNSKKRSKRVPISIRLEESLIDEIGAYCSWASIARFQDFFEQAAEYILKNDKDWKKAKDSPNAVVVKKMKKN